MRVLVWSEQLKKKKEANTFPLLEAYLLLAPVDLNSQRSCLHFPRAGIIHSSHQVSQKYWPSSQEAITVLFLNGHDLLIKLLSK